MTIRESTERLEHELLSEYAAFADESMGRDEKEPQCDIRTVYQRDRDRIIHSKAFRRLVAKTQVFLAPQGDHYRTRLTHTLEVSQIARTMAKALRLNEDLTEAIALGHDLGHTPFGHAGERALNEVMSCGFKHHEQSIRVVEVLDRRPRGRPRNHTKEVRDGNVNPQTEGNPSTLEGKIVRLSDKIAYVNHDIDDAIRGQIITEEMIPKAYRDVLGNNLGERLNTLIHDIVTNSEGKDDITMSKPVEEAMFALRRFMFDSVYSNPKAKNQEGKAEAMLKMMFDHYMEHSEVLPQEFLERMERRGETLERTVCDYIAGMTDRYAVAKFNEMAVPTSWGVY
ncbi:MAG: deoxyguanosinetriphosphate triphosphohydrolase [Lachnospiraceae bacterium]|nr:deoxyguanosinetriphosphate triphosphohydrolase [Lachnospiraceae bacterium]